MPKKIDLIGHKYGKLIVVSEAGYKYLRIAWNCKCECGTLLIATGNDLRTGKIRTCKNATCANINTEAAHIAVTTHNLSNTRIYRIWSGMKHRCKTLHPNYGAKGIMVCKEWDNFEICYQWAIKMGYSDKLTIDRIDNNKGYYPENCRWVSRKDQARNTSRNRVITYNGISKCINEWAEYLNINTRTLLHRINYGWTIERAFNTKSRSGYEKYNT